VILHGRMMLIIIEITVRMITAKVCTLCTPIGDLAHIIFKNLHMQLLSIKVTSVEDTFVLIIFIRRIRFLQICLQ
jgi:hypothetical protein